MLRCGELRNVVDPKAPLEQVCGRPGCDAVKTGPSLHWGKPRKQPDEPNAESRKPFLIKALVGATGRNNTGNIVEHATEIMAVSDV